MKYDNFLKNLQTDWFVNFINQKAIKTTNRADNNKKALKQKE